MKKVGERFRLRLAYPALAIYDFRRDALRLKYVQEVALLEATRRH